MFGLMDSIVSISFRAHKSVAAKRIGVDGETVVPLRPNLQVQLPCRLPRSLSVPFSFLLACSDTDGSQRRVKQLVSAFRLRISVVLDL
jgi:hypothetical protein